MQPWQICCPIDGASCEYLVIIWPCAGACHVYCSTQLLSTPGFDVKLSPNSKHDQQAVSPRQQGALAAAGMLQQKETTWAHLGTFRKNFGRRKYPNGQTSRTNLLQWNILKYGEQDVSFRSLVWVIGKVPLGLIVALYKETNLSQV